MKKIYIIALPIVLSLYFFVFPTKVNAACPSVNAAVNSSTQTVNVPLSGTYTVWSRISVPDTTNNSYFLQIDNACFTVGTAATLPTNTWIWVNYQDSNPNSLISQTLSTGTHTVRLLGYKAQVKVDKIIFVTDTCIPQNFGNNCNAPVSISPTNIVPTFVCIGGVPCTSPDPSVTVPVPSASANPVSQSPTDTLSPSTNPTIDPCGAAQTSDQAASGRKHHKTSHGNGFFSQFFAYLLQLLMQLFMQLGINLPTPTPNPTPIPTTQPGTSIEPTLPCQTSITPVTTGMNPTTTPGVNLTVTPTPIASQGTWPGPSNTGVKPGTVLTTYTGPTTITSCGVVIDSKTISGGLIITAGNGTHSASTPCVTIKNSKINGQIDLSYSSQNHGPLLITDSEIAIPNPNLGNFASLTQSNWYAWRDNIHGGRTNTQCDGYCELHDSWLHDNFYVSGAHMGGFLSNGNYGNPILIDHNSIICNMINPSAQDNNGGCSGDINFYGDFSSTTHITVTNNIFRASLDASYCAYTGAHQSGKPYQDGTNLIWKNNVWERGSNNKCASYGPVPDWSNNSGNVWSNNTWVNGGDVLTTP